MLVFMFLSSEILAIELILMQGIMCSGITYYIQGKVMKERGPVFVTAFNPLCMIIVAIMGSIILAEEITLGRYEFLLSHCSYSGTESGYTYFSEIDRVVGATIIVIGLYSLMWGKSKDHLTQSSEDDEKKGASDDDEKKGAFELPISATDAMKSNSADHATVAEIPSANSP